VEEKRRGAAEGWGATRVKIALWKTRVSNVNCGGILIREELLVWVRDLKVGLALRPTKKLRQKGKNEKWGDK